MLDKIDIANRSLENKPIDRTMSLSPSLRMVGNSIEGQKQIVPKNYSMIASNFKEFDKKYSVNYIRETINNNRKNKSKQ